MKVAAASLASPLAIIRLPRRTWALLIAYMGAAGGLLFLARYLLVANEGRIKHALLDYLFPESWHFAAEFVVERYFAAQERVVIINAVIAASLILVSISLFWLKELVSSSFENDASLVAKPVEEHPLWEQAWQEVKLLLFFLAAQGSIFWIGYHPGSGWKLTAEILSYLFLFFTYAIDFLSPVFQRHKGHYSRIIKTLVAHAPAALIFGAIFALPTIVVGRIWAEHADWSWTQALGVLFSVNVLTICWACVSGTWLASRMMPTFDNMPRSTWLTRIASWFVILALVAGNGYAFASLGLAVHHKSQILKCKYDVVWSSFGFEKPSLLGLLGDKVEVGVHFDVHIENPTEFDVEIEKNRLEIRHRGDQVATTRIQPIEVPAGEKVRQRIDFKLAATPSMIRKGRELLDRDSWKIVLVLELAPGFEFPIYLMGYD